MVIHIHTYQGVGNTQTNGISCSKFDYIDFKVEKVPADSQEHESFTVKSSDIKSPLPLKFIKDELELISENDQLICMMCGKNEPTITSQE